MKIKETHIKGLLVIEPDVFGDSRGYFMESFCEKKFREQTGVDVRFVQDNESRSSYGVVRGLHFQRAPYAQAKLVRVVSGRAMDVAVDLREGSGTYGQHFCMELSGDNHLQLFIPKGFAHGFAVLSDEVVFQYKCDEYYAPEAEAAVIWNDPDLGIDWRLPMEDIRLSGKDKNHPRLKDLKL